MAPYKGTPSHPHEGIYVNQARVYIRNKDEHKSFIGVGWICPTCKKFNLDPEKSEALWTDPIQKVA